MENFTGWKETALNKEWTTAQDCSITQFAPNPSIKQANKQQFH